MPRLTPVLAVLAAIALTGCSGEPAPSAITPVLDGWRQAGVSCSDPVVGMPDNLPQWTCHARFHDVPLSLTFIGDDAGVVDLTVQVAAGTAPATAISVFSDLVLAMRAFPAARGDLLTWIRSWNGSPGLAWVEVPGIRASIEADTTWISLVVRRLPRFAKASPDQLPGMSPPLPNQGAATL